MEPPIISKLQPNLSKVKIDKLKLQSLRYELSEARVDAYLNLVTKRRQMLWPKDKDLTELDRKTRLDGDTCELQKTYDFLVALEDIVSDVIKSKD